MQIRNPSKEGRSIIILALVDADYKFMKMKMKLKILFLGRGVKHTVQLTDPNAEEGWGWG